jgi:hypothetical protein
MKTMPRDHPHRSGEDELIDMMMADETPEAKLQTSTALAALITTAAVVITTLCNKDPWGACMAAGAGTIGRLSGCMGRVLDSCIHAPQ